MPADDAVSPDERIAAGFPCECPDEDTERFGHAWWCEGQIAVEVLAKIREHFTLTPRR